MSFGNGTLLVGMLLGIIPIVIHLINKHRAKLRRFAAIEFLLMSDKRVARKLKLKQFMILALRVALLMLLAFALAKPYIEPDLAAEGSSLAEPGSAVLVIDDSLSMYAVDAEGVTLLQRAVDRAKAFIEEGGVRTSIAIVAAGNPARTLTKELSYNKDTLLRALSRIDTDPATATPRGPDLQTALREAGRVLSESAEPRRNIIIIGDQAAHSWGRLEYEWSFVPASNVDVVDVREGRPLTNVAVTGVDVIRVSRGATPEAELEVTATNHGSNRTNVTVEVTLGDKVSAETIDIPPGERVVLPFKMRAPAGATRGQATIRTAVDALASDNTWHFTVAENHSLNVLVVNGAPRSLVYLDEIFFLRAALASEQVGDVPINAIYVTQDELTPARVRPMDVVILANAEQLAPEQRLALTNFVEGGGGLFIAAGDGIDERELGKSFGDLLPYPVRGIKTVAKRDDPKAALSALTLASVDFDHPVLEVFDGVDDASLFKARIYRYALLDTSGREGSRAIANYAGGIPALVERRLGQGKVVMLTTTVDRDWSDLSLRTSFVPLVHRLCQYLGHALDREGGVGHVAGKPVRVKLPDGRGELSLRRPDGAVVGVVDDPDDAIVGALFLEDIDLSGQYTLSRANDPRRAVNFAVNADRAESNLQLADEKVVREVVTELTKDNGVLPSVDVAETQLLSSAADSPRTILWPWVLAGLMLLFLAEAWLIVRN